MATKAGASFDPKEFLAKVGTGRSIGTYFTLTGADCMSASALSSPGLSGRNVFSFLARTLGGSAELVERIQVASLESRELPEPVQIMNPDNAFSQDEQTTLAQFTQNAIHVELGIA